MTQISSKHTPDLRVASADSLSIIQAHFEAVVMQATEALRQDAETRDEPGKLITHVGEYLVQAAESWSRLTDDLVQIQRINKVVTDTHENSRTRSHLCDISNVVRVDIEVSKLRAIQELTAEFSRNVRDVWEGSSKS